MDYVGRESVGEDEWVRRGTGDVEEGSAGTVFQGFNGDFIEERHDLLKVIAGEEWFAGCWVGVHEGFECRDERGTDGKD